MDQSHKHQANYEQVARSDQKHRNSNISDFQIPVCRTQLHTTEPLKE